MSCWVHMCHYLCTSFYCDKDNVKVASWPLYQTGDPLPVSLGLKILLDIQMVEIETFRSKMHSLLCELRYLLLTFPTCGYFQRFWVYGYKHVLRLYNMTFVGPMR